MTSSLNVSKQLILAAALSFFANVGCAATPSKSSPIPIADDAPLNYETTSAPSSPKTRAATKTSAKSGEAKTRSRLMPGEKSFEPNDDQSDRSLKLKGTYPVEKKELNALKSLNDRYRTASSVTMDISKVVKLGLIGSERKSSGKLYLAKGELRMELEGAEKTLLVVNKKNLFAVTYPDAQLKGAALRVIKGATSSKKAQSQALTGLLGGSGILKSFKPTARQVIDGGEEIFFLQPTKDQTEFTRAQLRVSADGKEIRELHYWDARDNETTLSFSNVKFGAKLDAKLFNYTPPANADVMNL